MCILQSRFTRNILREEIFGTVQRGVPLRSLDVCGTDTNFESPLPHGIAHVAGNTMSNISRQHVNEFPVARSSREIRERVTRVNNASSCPHVIARTYISHVEYLQDDK